MKISEIEISFDNEPELEILNDKNIFIKNKTKKTLHEIIWEYINENIESVVNILFQLDEEINYEKIYEKEIFINTNDKSALLKQENKSYFILVIKVLLKYKIIKQKEV